MMKMDTDLLFGIIANSKTRVRCLFCGVYVPKANKCIGQHVNGFKHKENIESMNNNGICFKSDTLFCKVCNTTLSCDESVLQHLESNSHCNWQMEMEDLIDGEYISLKSFLSSETAYAFCEVCHANIPCSLDNVEEHVAGLAHRSNIIEKFKSFNGIFDVENNDEVWCKICDEYIENIEPSILDHMDNDTHHMGWLIEMDDLIDDNHISIDDYLANEFEEFAYCELCNVEVLCDAKVIKQHINSKPHSDYFDDEFDD